MMQDYGGKMLVFQNAVPSLGMTVLIDADQIRTPGEDVLEMTSKRKLL